MKANDEERPPLHFGLDTAEIRTVLQTSNLEALMRWARNGILNFRIPLGSHNYETLLDAPDVFKVNDVDQRREYFHMIFTECLKNTPESKRAQYPNPEP